MLYLLVAFILLIMFISYSINGNKLLSFSMAFACSYLICAVVAAINVGFWDKDISLDSMIIITFSILFVAIGEVLGYSLSKSRYQNDNGCIWKVDLSCHDIKSNWMIIAALTFIVFCSLMCEINYFYRWSVYLGNTGGYFDMLKYGKEVRDSSSFALYEGRNIVNRYLIHEITNRISPVIVYYFIYIIISKVAHSEFNIKDIVYLFAPLFHIGSIFFSTARIGIIYLFIFVFIMGFMQYFNIRGWNKKNNAKIIKIAFISLISFFVIFWLLGILTGKNKVMTFWGQVSDYTGASLIAFDIWHNQFTTPNGDLIDLISGIRNVMVRLGFADAYNPNYEFLTWQNGSTNIYTAMRGYIDTIGVAGNYLLHLLLGLIYGYNLMKIRLSRITRRGLILFCMFFYVAVLSCIAERFCSTILTVTSLSEFCMIYIIDRMFFGVRQKIVSNQAECI